MKKFLNWILAVFEKYRHYNFLIFMMGSISLAIILVITSMIIYDRSGAAQLDLSRPGYVSVRAQSITNDNEFKDYSSTGSINQKSIDEFKQLYDKSSEKAKAVDAFGGDPLSAEALGISNPATENDGSNAAN